ncbi:hypothetical protein [Pseudomonas sp. NPDC089569]|uniref:hypothetical protein n=1 Tax=Pseudomonas sp. NPDC089569 TaxID=3390722 RepID=UPI003D00CA3E
MNTSRKSLVRYRYDALDRLTALEPTGQTRLQRFYRHEHLVTQLQGQSAQTVFQHDRQLLAEQQRMGDDIDSRLLATDQQRSVMQFMEQGESVR